MMDMGICLSIWVSNYWKAWILEFSGTRTHAHGHKYTHMCLYKYTYIHAVSAQMENNMTNITTLFRQYVIYSCIFLYYPKDIYSLKICLPWCHADICSDNSNTSIIFIQNFTGFMLREREDCWYHFPYDDEWGENEWKVVDVVNINNLNRTSDKT